MKLDVLALFYVSLHTDEYEERGQAHPGGGRTGPIYISIYLLIHLSTYLSIYLSVVEQSSSSAIKTKKTYELPL